MKCKVCGNKLSGRKRVFCSQSCSVYSKRKSNQENYRKYNPFLPKRKCVSCSKEFQPRGESHQCCSNLCRESYRKQQNRIRAKIRADNPKSNVKYWETFTPQVKDTTRLSPLPVSNSGYSDSIKEYLDNGGEIKLLPAQLNGRTPEVNLTNLSGWSVESLFGFGFEIDLLDNLVETVEEADAY